MAANKFATMLHKHHPKLTVILVYAFLEWILILLLLLNSLFFFLITKFANYFGLKPPCLWCSRLFVPSANTHPLCDSHASEISGLGFCSDHRKLAPTHGMCADCLASCPNYNRSSIAVPTRIAFISLDDACDGDAVRCCSCCSRSFSDQLYSPYDLLLKHSWKALKFTEDSNGKIAGKTDCLENEVGGEEHHLLSDFGSFGLKDSVEEECSGSESNLICFGKEGEDDDRKSEEDRCVIDDDLYELNCLRSSLAHSSAAEDFSLEFIDLHFDMDFEGQTDRLIPVEFLDSSIFGNHQSSASKQQDPDEQVEGSQSSSAIEKHTISTEAEMLERTMEESSVISVQKIEQEQDNLQAQQEATNGIKFPFDEVQEQESTPPSSYQEDHSSSKPNGAETANSSATCMVDNKNGTDDKEKILIEEEIESAERNQDTGNQLLLIHPETKEAEDDKFPETPTSVDSYNCLHKKLLYFKRESGTEESIDGSISSEIDVGDPNLTVEKLSTALKSERKALNALYAELEEERSASAIAASQTMAMINRLQEEKAAMQMEALQYQRMMEEQSEYDQEALQLLNELMLKREREKLELERELEVYRKKVMDYEAKERVRMIRRTSSATSSSSNSEGVDELSIDLNCEPRDEDNGANDEVVNLEEIALDCVKQIGVLDDSLAEFEEERLSILDQLKVLEEKLITLHNNELEDRCEMGTPEESEEPKTMGAMAKSLLPLLDAAENETEERFMFEGDEASELVEMEQTLDAKFESDMKKVGLEEEVDHVYERLQALEADREFLKHCMSSIQMGDKGMDLLQEILQHLRDLRAVEVRVKNLTDDPLD